MRFALNGLEAGLHRAQMGVLLADLVSDCIPGSIRHRTSQAEAFGRRQAAKYLYKVYHQAN